MVLFDFLNRSAYCRIMYAVIFRYFFEGIAILNVCPRIYGFNPPDLVHDY